MSTFQQDWAGMAFPRPQPARKERLLPPLFEKRGLRRRSSMNGSENTFMIWGGEKGSPAFFKGTFSPDGNTCTGAWVFPGGGGYSTTMTRVTSA